MAIKHLFIEYSVYQADEAWFTQLTNLFPSVTVKILSKDQKEDGLSKLIEDSKELADRTIKIELKKAGYHHFSCLFLASSKSFLSQLQAENLKHIAVGSPSEFYAFDFCVQSVKSIDPEVLIQHAKPTLMPSDPWCIVENELNYARSPYLESLFASSNGKLGVRSTHPEVETELGGFRQAGTFLNTYYELENLENYRDVDGNRKQSQIMLNLFDWMRIHININGKNLELKPENIIAYERKVHFSEGVVKRSMVCRQSNGQTFRIEFYHFTQRLKNQAWFEYSVTPLDSTATITFSHEIKPNTFTRQFDYDGAQAEILETEKGYTAIKLTTKETKMATLGQWSYSLENDGNKSDLQHSYSVENDVLHSAKVEVEKEKALRFVCLMDLAILSDPKENHNHLQKDCALAFEEGIGKSKETLASYWKQFWAENDIRVEGNDRVQQAIRFNLFHLQQQHPLDQNMSISATGLTGANYMGWIFWDTEIFMCPFFNFTQKDRMRELLYFRYLQLEGARKYAIEQGHCGVAFPWSTINGTETNHGELVARAQVHISADIVYAIQQYFDVHGDEDFIYDFGVEIMLEVSRYYSNLGKFIAHLNNAFVINVVCGPDEYSYHVNNNTYTNFQVKECFRISLKWLSKMQEKRPEQYQALIKKINFSDAEREKIESAAENIVILYNANLGIHEQDDCYLSRDPVDMSKIPLHYEIKKDIGMIELSRMQVTKQADVVLLMMLQSGHFSKETKENNYRFYEPKTTHASSLSHCAHQIMATELGDHEKANYFFEHSMFMDLEDIKRNTSDGIHFACVGGNYMMMTYGYGGLRISEEGLSLTPQVPDFIDALSFPLVYQGNKIKVDIRRNDKGLNTSQITLLEGCGTSLLVYGQSISLKQKGEVLQVAQLKEKEAVH